MSPVIYLDYAATTPVDKAVAERMMSCLTLDGTFANPASRSHRPGWQAEQLVEAARIELAQLIDCSPIELVWTSGATEADNLAIQGVVRHAIRVRRKENPSASGTVHLITSVIEHKAVIDTCKALEREYADSALKVEVSWLTPDASGHISAEQVRAALRDDTVLVSIMHMNNELGSINDIAALAEEVAPHSALFHVDAAQSAGKLPLSMKSLAVDLLSCCAHKIYGPKGIGALYVRRSVKSRLDPMIHGGGHEGGLRSGTLATHQIVGFGEAARLAGEAMASDRLKLERQRKVLLAALSQLNGFTINGAEDPEAGALDACWPGILNVRFATLDAEALMLAMPAIALASGSACNSASLSASYVLRAIGLSEAEAAASVRISLGRMTTDDEVKRAAERITEVVSRMRPAASAV
ncbi:aminotransferase class V-fold PLP-dependent enzyme [Allohahella marinimesophila]|uniref:cysteine desulfurase n=1 Tax=Allohahella marinimesophila TaxID=1054972 RepID=A0ABP7P4R7_9GAMM